MLTAQRFARQVTEDGPDPSSKWGKDRTGSDAEDPDSEDFMPIPDAGSSPVLGKLPAQDPLRDWSDDDDDECQVLEVINTRPLAFKFPLPSTPVDLDDQVLDAQSVAVGGRAGSKKRSGTRPSAPSKRKKVTSHKARP